MTRLGEARLRLNRAAQTMKREGRLMLADRIEDAALVVLDYGWTPEGYHEAEKLTDGERQRIVKALRQKQPESE